MSCKDRVVVQRRTSSPGSPWCDDHLTGKGQHVLPFVVSFSYFFVRDLIQLLEAQRQKALADLISHEHKRSDYQPPPEVPSEQLSSDFMAPVQVTSTSSFSLRKN